MICKNCNKEIRLHPDYPNVYVHSFDWQTQCYLFATPILGHINRHLDAAAILAEMEARHPTPPPYRAHKPNPDYVDGTFEGEL